jgi:hypothetical protein
MTEVTSKPRVFWRHVRAARPRICFNGSRSFFEKHGLDWRDFQRNGIPGEKLVEIGNPIALRALAEAEKESAGGR